VISERPASFTCYSQPGGPGYRSVVDTRDATALSQLDQAVCWVCRCRRRRDVEDELSYTMLPPKAGHDMPSRRRFLGEVTPSVRHSRPWSSSMHWTRRRLARLARGRLTCEIASAYGSPLAQFTIALAPSLMSDAFVARSACITSSGAYECGLGLRAPPIEDRLPRVVPSPNDFAHAVPAAALSNSKVLVGCRVVNSGRQASWMDGATSGCDLGGKPTRDRSIDASVGVPQTSWPLSPCAAG
jgi:hypothetical protein